MRFYTYIWLREDGTPYYVGKGSGKRAFSSEMHRLRCPEDPARIIIQEFDSEEEAFAAECILIDFYGRADIGTGCLRNLTSGGDGTREPSPVIRERMRRRMKGNKQLLGHKHSPETLQQMRETHMKSARAQKHLKDMQENNVGTKLTPEARDRIRRSRVGRKFPRKPKLSIEDRVAYQGRLDLCSVADYGDKV